MVGFGGPTTQKTADSCRKAGAYYVVDLPHRSKRVVCDGGLYDSEVASVHLDSFLAQVPLHDGLGCDQPYGDKYTSGGGFPALDVNSV